MKADNADYPEIDWPVDERNLWFLRSQRDGGRIRFLFDTGAGIGWTPWVEMVA